MCGVGCLSDFSQLPGAGGGGGRSGVSKTWNQPHLSVQGHPIDLCIEKYVEEKIVKDKAAQDVIGAYFVEPTSLVYGEIPQGYTPFSVAGIVGDILVYDKGELAVYSKGEINLSGYEKLPVGWERVVYIA